MSGRRKIKVSAESRENSTRIRRENAQNLSHYNLLTFLPKFVFQQITQVSILYFLVIALLQQIPDISPTGTSYGVFLKLSIDYTVIYTIKYNLQLVPSDFRG